MSKQRIVNDIIVVTVDGYQFEIHPDEIVAPFKDEVPLSVWRKLARRTAHLRFRKETKA